MTGVLPSELQSLVSVALLVLFRISAIVSMMPAFGEISIPVRVKFAISVGMTVIVLPAVASDFEGSELSGLPVVTLAMREIGIGLVLGLSLRIFLFCLQIAGSIAAQSTSLSQILGTAGVDPLPALGHVLTFSGLALAMILGLHIAAASFIIMSYEWLPLGQFPGAGGLADMVVAQIASGFRLAFAMAAPFYILALLYNLTLGVINRAMPQLMVAFVGAPVITAGALAMLAVSASIIIGMWNDAFFTFLTSPGIW